MDTLCLFVGVEEVEQDCSTIFILPPPFASLAAR